MGSPSTFAGGASFKPILKPVGIFHGITFNLCWWRIIQTNLETSWHPLDEGDFCGLLDLLYGLVRFLRFDLTSVVEGDGHVLVFDWVEVNIFDQKALGVKSFLSQVPAVVALSLLLLFVDQGGKTGGHEVKTRERNQVRLELVHVDVQFTVISESSGH